MPTQKRLDRSCILCHQRKIRCDKKSPCGNCTRADVLCCFPKAEQPVRRPHKTTIADVSSRLARLERTIQALAKDSPINGCVDTPPSKPVEDFSTPLRSDELLDRAPSEERLINGDCSSRYFNESFLSRIMEEEKDIHSLIGLQVDEKSQPEKRHAIQLEPLLSNFHKPVTGESYHPTKSCAVQLWQAFVNNVDPMIKIFHLPTTQAIVYAAIKNTNESGADTNALLFSIYFAATASLNHKSLVNILGNDKTTALNQFKRGLEQSLATSKFLDTPNLVTLQAITLYIRCLRVFIRGRSLWSLNGLVVRCAQSIGLHRDGKNFNLSPFECEIRRRLWWYIVANDSRVGEDLGLMILNFDGATDVELPLNVNDNQLEPNMKDLPPAEPRWTEMSFTLIIMEVNRVQQEINQSRLRYEDIDTYEAARQKIIHSMIERQDHYLQYCDENIPAQRAAYLIGRILTAKLQFITRRHSRSTASENQNLSQDTQETFEKACDILELSRQFSTDDMLQGFRWICQSFPQYNMLMYLLWRLCKDVEGWNVERAWELIDASFEGQGERRHDWNWAVLENLRAKARLMRTSVKGQDGTLMTGMAAKAESSDVSGNGTLQNLGWTSEQLGDYDWSALLEDVDMQSYDL
ncbi:fungal-specific transcription factor domain-containing protein [Leptodontidium sp. MPI-SDFR-AT-0119]|nr:fungal-specific transcription factor domain-containing protein [Leptodontidium sp. MPI-SDFR-AT-0119]